MFLEFVVDAFLHKLARNNIANAGFAKTTRVVVGPAIDGLKALRSEPPFDLVFIDADKQSSLEYFIEAKRLVRPGGIIVRISIVLRSRCSVNTDYYVTMADYRQCCTLRVRVEAGIRG